MLAKKNPTKTPAWKALKDHFSIVQNKSLQTYFDENPSRFSDFSVRFEDILVDYSKNHISQETMDLFVAFANEMELSAGIEAMFSGSLINETEGRAVLHTALRSNNDTPVLVNGEDVKPKVKSVLEQMKGFTDRFHRQECLGYTGKPLDHVINIGRIGL